MKQAQKSETPITFRPTPELRRLLTTYSKTNRIKPSIVIRAALEQYLVPVTELTPAPLPQPAKRERKAA